MKNSIETYWHRDRYGLVRESLLDDVEVDEVEDSNDNVFNENDCVYCKLFLSLLSTVYKFSKETEGYVKYHFESLMQHGYIHKYEIETASSKNAYFHIWFDAGFISFNLFNNTLFYIASILVGKNIVFGLTLEEFGDEVNLQDKPYFCFDNFQSQPMIVFNTDEFLSILPVGSGTRSGYSEKYVLSSIVNAAARYDFIPCLDEEAKIYQLHIIRRMSDDEIDNIEDYREIHVKKLIIKSDGTIIHESEDKSLMNVSLSERRFHDGYLPLYLQSLGKFCIIDRDGNAVKNVSFKELKAYSENRLIVKTDSIYYDLLKTDGTLLSDKKACYTDMKPFKNGFAEVKYENGKYNFIDVEGKELLREPVLSCENFDIDGYALVTDKDYSICIIDNKGNVLLQNKWNKYRFVESIGNGLYVVSVEGANSSDNKKLINLKGKELLDFMFSAVENGGFHNGFMWVCNSKNGYTYVDETGEVLCRDRNGNVVWFDKCGVFDEGGNAMVFKKGEPNKYNFIDSNGQLISDIWFDKLISVDLDIPAFREDFAKVTISKYGLTYYNFIDRDGKLLVDGGFRGLVSKNGFSDGCIVVDIDGNSHYNVIDKYGNVKLDNSNDYVYIDAFSHGLARVQNKLRQWNYITTDGKLVSKKQWFDKVLTFDGIACCVSKIDEHGNWLSNYMNRHGFILFRDAWIPDDEIKVQYNKECIVVSKSSNGMRKFNMITSDGMKLLPDWTMRPINQIYLGDDILYRIGNDICVDDKGEMISYI